MSGRFVRSAGVVAAAIGVALLALAVAAALVVHSGAANEWLRTQLADRLGPRVRFTDAEVVWAPEPSLQLTGVSLVAAPDAANPEVAAQQVTCTPQLGPLLHGNVILDAVRINGLRIDAAVQAAPSGAGDPLADALAWIRANALPGPLPEVRVRDGDLTVREDARTVHVHIADARLHPDGAGARLDLSAALQPSGSVTAQLALASLAAADTSRLTIALDAAQLDLATLRPWLSPDLAALAATGALRVSAQVARDGGGSLGGDVTIELADGALAWSQWRIESPLRITAHPTWGGGGGIRVTNGTVAAARCSGSDITAQTVGASFEYENGALRIPRVQFEALGGSWNGGGRLGIATPLAVDATLTGKAVQCAALRATLDAHAAGATLPSCDGELQLSVTASGSPSAAWNADLTVSTAGTVAWPGGRADGPVAVAAELLGDGGRLRSATGTASAQRIAMSTLTAQNVATSYEYDAGTLRLAPLRAMLFGGTVTYNGSVPLEDDRWDGELSAAGVDVAALSAALGGSALAGAPRGTIDASARLAGTGTTAISGTATVRLGASLLAFDPPLRIDPPAQIAATLQYGGGHVRVSGGQLQVQRIQYGPIAAGAVAARFAADDTGALQISSAEATAFAGHWKGSGTAAVSSAVHWNANVHAKHIDCNALLAAADALDDDDWPRCPGGIADITARVRKQAAGGANGSANIALSAGSFLWDRLEIDAPAHAGGAFTIHGDDVSLTGVNAGAARARYGPLIGTQATGHLSYADVTDRLTFDQLRFTSCGGEVTHSGWFTLAEGGRFNGQLTADHVQPHALAVMLDETQLDIPFEQFDLETQFDGTATAAWKQDLDMVGSVLLRDGTLPAAAILRPIWNALVGDGSMRNFVDQPTRVSHVSDSFTLRNGTFDTADLSLLSNDYSVTGVGRIGMDGSLDLDTRIQLTSSGMQKMFFFATLPLPTGALPALPPIPARVKGTLNDPILRPDVSALPASTARWFLDAVLDTPRSVGSAIVRPLQRLWHGVFGGGSSADPGS